jgi:hypothetical protein
VRSKEQILDDIENTQDRLDRLNRELKIVKRIPNEPKIGSVITFDVRDTPGGTTYTFVGFRSVLGWFMTGTRTKQQTWLDLISMMDSDIDVETGRRDPSFEIFLPGEGSTFEYKRGV